jgi:acetyl esterase
MTKLRETPAQGYGSYTPEMQAEVDRLAQVVTVAVDFSRPPDDATREIDLSIRAVWNFDLPDVASVRHLDIPVQDPSLDAVACPAVVYEPAEPGDGVIFFVHGGGWTFGSLESHERLMRVLCNEARQTVVGVHYRLAPQNPYPAALNDVVSALRRVLSTPAAFGLPAGPVVVAGDSAGANLALAAMLHELGAGRPLPAGALLFYGAFGRDFETPSYRVYGEGHGLTKPIMRQLWDWYAPLPATHRDPLAVPLLAADEALRAMPPLFLVAAEMDPLASDTFNLKERLDRLGRSDALWVEPGVIHGFLEMTAVLEAARRSARKASEAANDFMTRARRSEAKG